MSSRTTSTHPGRARRALVAGLALAGLASFSLVSGLAAQSARAADEDPQLTGAPAVGSCYDATYAQAAKPALAQESFDCATALHTTWVLGVAKVPARYQLTFDSPEFSRWASSQCATFRTATVGGDVSRNLRSLFQFGKFVPTQAQIDAGARWMSCTAAIYQDSALRRTRTVKVPTLKTGIPNEAAWCLRSGGTDSRPCVLTHTHRAVWATVVYRTPTEANMRSAGYTCRKHVKNYRYSRYNTWKRSSSSFNLVCFEPTKS